MKKKNIFIGAAILVIASLFVSSFSPEWTIRRHILGSLQPINSLKAKITTLGRVDAEYGHLYNVSGFMNRATGDELGFFYLKKLGPFWYVASTGTGP
ncbi:hypothetical protein [Bacillus sp. FJAT-26390]|uniref:hypothetical protein n=1 Tax=Bacillus sp. FJAT-26390 TaxID=1743142 RepID=UPI000807BF12|nr:hypothetical protein [Bacillus sp. FJAT-26390]OBZ13842.1 hypothetical protein A7975_13670 [Bacillus sp. FJAT-26390]